MQQEDSFPRLDLLRLASLDYPCSTGVPRFAILVSQNIPVAFISPYISRNISRVWAPGDGAETVVFFLKAHFSETQKNAEMACAVGTTIFFLSIDPEKHRRQCADST